jgi:hypothetical protein
MAAIHSTIRRTFAGIQQPFAGMDWASPPFLQRPHALPEWLLLLWYCFSSPMENFQSSSFAL